MLALENQRGPWGVKWPCPSCTRRRWCCTDTGGSERWWTRRSCSGTSSTWAQAWWEDNPHCPVDGKTHLEFRVLVLALTEMPARPKRLPRRTLRSSCGWSRRSACCGTFRSSRCLATETQTRVTDGGSTAVSRLYCCSIYLCILSTGWKNWWDLTAPSLGPVYMTRSTRPPQTAKTETVENALHVRHSKNKQLNITG